MADSFMYTLYTTIDSVSILILRDIRLIDVDTCGIDLLLNRGHHFQVIQASGSDINVTD